DVEPVWSRDGKSVYFVSARSGGFDIYRHDLASHAETIAVRGQRPQFQPAISPDGTQIAYVSPVEGKLGTGGLWVQALQPDAKPRLVRYEETEYRMKPAWTPDGQAFLYVSDESGSNDIAIVPAEGGNQVLLTVDGRDEYAPALSPDGKRFAFVSNR